MSQYTLTAYDKDGAKLLEEQFEENDEEKAKAVGQSLLIEKGYQTHTSRLTSSDGRLILFHR